MLYRAFISYSHADAKWANWLMRRLESYRVPANLVGSQGRDGRIPAKLGKFFRDRDELPSAGSLSKTINDALEKSHALIVICSPSSAQSQWVNAEIDAYRQKGSEDTIFSFIVDGDPASRDAGVAAFPYALLKPNVEGEPEREPLAADARKEGDGRERAFIKLVAGLLGVGFDDLAQREAQQRHKRMAIITGASLAGMTLAVVLAVTAYVARNDAERRQAQAEDIIGFMLGDLRKNLTKVGRLDLMRSVDDKATGYFSSLDPRDLSDRALEEQARSLTGIGEVRVNEGNHKEAMIAFREAHARSTALYERAPKNGQRLFDLAQAEYWIGYVAWQQGRFDDAKIWLGKYRDSGVKLAAMDRSNFAWQKEAAYGYHNMAVLDESLGKYEQAESSMLAERALYVDWLKQYPKDYELRFEAGNIDSWLGSLAQRHGRLEDAEMYFSAYADAIAKNALEDSKTIRWKHTHAEALLFLYTVQIQRGRLKQAQESVAQSLQIMEPLYQQDTKNSEWLVTLGLCHLNSALLASNDSELHFQQTMSLIEKAYNLNPKNVKTADTMAKVYLAQGLRAVVDNDSSKAISFANDGWAIIEPIWKTQPNEELRLRKAQLLILKSEALIKNGDEIQAYAFLQDAINLLLENPGGELPFTRLDDLVKALSLLNQEQQAAPYRKRLNKAGYVTFKPFS